MRSAEALLEGSLVERHRLAAAFSLDQHAPQRFEFLTTFLLQRIRSRIASLSFA